MGSEMCIRDSLRTLHKTLDFQLQKTFCSLAKTREEERWPVPVDHLVLFLLPHLLHLVLLVHPPVLSSSKVDPCVPPQECKDFVQECKEFVLLLGLFSTLSPTGTTLGERCRGGVPVFPVPW